MNKILKITMSILLCLVLLVTGTLTGIYLAEKKAEEEKGSLFKSTSIAVVNLDEGATYNEKQYNYGLELLDSQKADIVITGLEDAKRGVEDGKYGAYMVIPSEFSKNITTINTQPQISVLLYEISNNLTTKAKDITINSVNEIQQTIKNDINYMYLYSVFKEVHQAQDNAKQVLTNDESDQKILNAISNNNLIQIIEIKEVEQLQNTIEKLELEPEFEKNAAVIQAIDVAYKNYLSKIKEEDAAIKSEFTQYKSNISQVQTEFEQIPLLRNDSNNYTLTTTQMTVDEYNTFLTTSIESIKGNLETVSADNKTENDAIIEQLTKFQTYLNDYNSELVNHNKYVAIKEMLQSQLDKITAIDQGSTSMSETSSYISQFNTNVKAIYDQAELDLNDKEAIIHTQKQELVNKDTKISDLNMLAEAYDAKAKLEKYFSDQYQKSSLIYDDTTKILDPDFVIMANNKTEVKTSLSKYAKAFGLPEPFLFEDYFANYRVKNPNQTPTQPTIIDPIGEPITVEGPLVDEKQVMESVSKDVNTLINDIYSDLDSYATNFTSTVDTTVLDTEIQNITNLIPNITTALLELDLIIPISLDTILKNVDTDLTPLSNEQIAYKMKMDNLLGVSATTYEAKVNQLVSFEPLKYIDGKEIDKYIGNYNSNNSDIAREVTDKDTEYFNFMNDVYRTSNEHVSSLQRDIVEQQQKSDEKVNSGLAQAKSSREITSIENKKLMQGFIDTLPHTRLGQSENTNVYTFMISPIDAEQTTTIATKEIQGINYDFILYCILIGGAVLLIGLFTYSKFRNMNQEKGGKN